MHAADTRALLAHLVDRFYERVRVDPDIGPVFHAAFDDWDAHKSTLLEFWSSIVLKTGTYRGNAMGRHRPLPIDRSHFVVWLALWRRTCADVLPQDLARTMVGHAERISESLQYGLGLEGGRALPLRVTAAGERAEG